MAAVTIRDLIDFALAAIILAVGLAALTLAGIRRRSNDGILLWFGVFAAIYGFREGLKNPLAIVAFAEPPIGREIVAWLDFLIVVPVMLFAEEILGNGWRPMIRWTVWAAGTYAVVGIAVGVMAHNPYRIPEPGVALLWLLFLAIGVQAIVKKRRPPAIPDAPLLVVGSAVFIAFVIDEHVAPVRFHAEPLGLFIFICCLGTIAIRRTLRNEQKLLSVEQEMASAQRIQSSILPVCEARTAGLKIAARYLPMASVAGDFYDFTPFGSSGIGILVADVAGHGVPAALIASMVKVAFAAQRRHAADPGSVLSGLNQIFCEQRTGQFITAGYLSVDAAERSAVYAGAGHPPLMVYRRSNRCVERFENNGLFLGFRPGEAYSNVEIPLRGGDRLLLYTDGLLEATNSREETFESQIEDRIHLHADLPVQAFADALLADVLAWSPPKDGHTQEDDVTLLVVDIGAD